MKKSELIEKLSNRFSKEKLKKNNQINSYIVEESVDLILDTIKEALANQERVEMRGFGAFELSCRRERIGRNPKTHEKLYLEAKYTPKFKAGKQLIEKLNK